MTGKGAPRDAANPHGHERHASGAGIRASPGQSEDIFAVAMSGKPGHHTVGVAEIAGSTLPLLIRQWDEVIGDQIKQISGHLPHASSIVKGEIRVTRNPRADREIGRLLFRRLVTSLPTLALTATGFSTGKQHPAQVQETVLARLSHRRGFALLQIGGAPTWYRLSGDGAPHEPLAANSPLLKALSCAEREARRLLEPASVAAYALHLRRAPMRPPMGTPLSSFAPPQPWATHNKPRI